MHGAIRLTGEPYQRNPIKTKAWIHIEKAIDYIQSCEPGVDMDNDSIAAAIGVTPNYSDRYFSVASGYFAAPVCDEYQDRPCAADAFEK